MKKLFVSALTVFFLTLTGFAQVKEKRDLDDFSVVSFGVSGEVYVKMGSQFSVTLEGDQDLLDEIRTKVINGKLTISKPDWRKARNKKLTAYITMPEIDGLSISGSGRLKNDGSLTCDDLDISVSGSGSIKLNDLKADKVNLSISGSGSVALEGTGADVADMRISGSGSIRSDTFKVRDAEVVISGSGRCEVWVEDALVARISGSGDLYYKGDPNIDAKSSGSGKVRSY